MPQQLLLQEDLNFCLQILSTPRTIVFVKSFRLKHENSCSWIKEERKRLSIVFQDQDVQRSPAP